MKKFSIRQIAEATGGKIVGCNDPEKVFIRGVSIDSRDELYFKLFVALKGERVDGHEYVDNAFRNGAVCCLCEKDVRSSGVVVLVYSTRDALKDLAKYYRESLDIKVVAITGSVGKTTTKDMIGSVLSKKYSVLKTEGNYNNEIGLPLSIFKIEENHEYAVLEMGMNNFNEIAALSKIAKPDICVITNIGFSHIENLDSQEGILKAKSEIFNYMSKDGKIILNGDDNMLLTLKDKFKNVLYYGSGNDNDVNADNIVSDGINSISCTIHIKNKNSFDVYIPYPGKHMVSNALAATAVGDFAGLENDQIKLGIETFKLSKMRMDIFTTEAGITIINDVYNASPSSMEASIDILTQAFGRKVCILGDMFELGDYSKNLHISVGNFVAEKNIDIIIFVGEKSRFSYDAVLEKVGADGLYYFESQEELLKKIDTLVLDGDIVLVKASRGMGFEKTVAWFNR